MIHSFYIPAEENPACKFNSYLLVNSYMCISYMRMWESVAVAQTAILSGHIECIGVINLYNATQAHT